VPLVKQIADQANVRFLVGLNRGVAAEYSVAERLVVSKAFSEGKWTPANDWAIIVLRDALSTRPVPVKSIPPDQFDTVSNSGSVIQVGYGMERLYLPSVVPSCHIGNGPYEGTFIHRCLVNFGYSGAPIIAEINGSPSVVGIGSDGSPELTLGMACSAIQFEKAVIELIQDVDVGKSLFLSSCASCHGIDGRGKGPLSRQLKATPADLTTLTKKNRGVFPVSRTYEIIDGRKALATHGARNMPIWGYLFMPSQSINSKPSNNYIDLSLSPDDVARTRILALIDYLNSIQER
jgi:mono/diheme cytochrome c family protein